MKRLVVGLGNPGPAYAQTRHNLGRRVADRLFEQEDLTPANVTIAGSRWGSTWPATYMNNSGGPIADFMRKNGYHPHQLLVIHDELDLPLGRLQLRRGGGAAGHKGVASIIEQLGADDFWRLRLGIGTPEQARREIPSEVFVLKPFTPEEQSSVKEMIEEAIRAAHSWLKDETDTIGR